MSGLTETVGSIGAAVVATVVLLEQTAHVAPALVAAGAALWIAVLAERPGRR